MILPPHDLTPPTQWIKWLFWLILGACSVIFAEVTCYSAPFPFFDGWGLTVVCPLYGLHTLVLAWLIFRRRRVTLETLFLAGAVFGLYEAYMTKVLWNPTWGDFPWTAGGIYIAQTAILVLFWHPVMAFIVPLLVGENIFTSSCETRQALPGWMQQALGSRKRILLSVAAFAVFCGMTEGVNAPSAGISLLSCAGAGVVFWGLALLWRLATRKRAYTLRDLLPSDREALVLGGLLLAGYIGLGLILRPEALPRSLVPHLTIWALYLILFALLALNFRRAPEPAAQTTEPAAQVTDSTGEFPAQQKIRWPAMALFWLVFPASAALFTALKPLATIGVVLSWVVGIGAGIVILVRAARPDRPRIDSE
jgi:hypothetical protein